MTCLRTWTVAGSNEDEDAEHAANDVDSYRPESP